GGEDGHKACPKQTGRIGCDTIGFDGHMFPSLGGKNGAPNLPRYFSRAGCFFVFFRESGQETPFFRKKPLVFVFYFTLLVRNRRPARHPESDRRPRKHPDIRRIKKIRTS